MLMAMALHNPLALPKGLGYSNLTLNDLDSLVVVMVAKLEGPRRTSHILCMETTVKNAALGWKDFYPKRPEGKGDWIKPAIGLQNDW